MRLGIPSLGALQAFEATARLGSFSRAAEELSLSHSAVYRQVTNLEGRLGVELFIRVRRRLALTDAGREYAARIRRHLEQLEKDTLSLVSRTAIGRSLHLAVLPTLATHWLLPRLNEFAKHYPDITVNLSTRTLPFKFSDQPFDAAIYHALQLWPNTRGSALFAEKVLVPVCTAQAWAQAEQQLDRLVHFHMASRPEAWRDWYRSQGYDDSPAMSVGPRYELFSMILAAVQAGMGVGLIPWFLARAHLQSGHLISPVNEVLQVQEQYFFSYPAEVEPEPALLQLEQWLARAAQQESDQYL